VKAVVYKRYGSSKELGVAEFGYPSINEDQLLIAVRGAAINPYDWHLLRGTPYLARIQSGLLKPKEVCLLSNKIILETSLRVIWHFTAMDSYVWLPSQ